MASSDQSLAERRAKEIQRLNRQHEIWIKNIGYHIHPTILKNLPENPRIADIATGSGIFLIELAEQLHSTAQLDGFDISTRAFPSTSRSNVSFQVHDARIPFPDSLQGRYDVVHLRLLFALVSETEWESIAANAIQLLKPNGAIQWTEPGSRSGAVLRTGQFINPTTLRMLQQRLSKILEERSQQDYRVLPDIFEKRGLSRIYQDTLATDRIPETREAMTRITLQGLLAWARQIAKSGRSGFWTNQELEDIRARCEEEIAAGAYVRFEIEVTIGHRSDTVDGQESTDIRP